MHKSKSVLENEMHKIPWDLEIQTNHLILIRRPGRVLISKKKKTCLLLDFAALVNYRVKIKESEKVDKYLTVAKEQ